MRVLIGVITSRDNIDYFIKAMQHISLSSDYAEAIIGGDSLELDLRVIDFGPGNLGWIVGMGFPKSIIEKRENAGYCSNMNYLLDYAQENKYEYLFSINDDAFIHPKFIMNALKYIENQKILAVIGGLPQDVGRWNQPIWEAHLPQEEHAEYFIQGFSRLHWEASACLMNLDLIGAERFDEYFDPYGVVSDNDFFLRLAQKNYQVVQLGFCRFFHCRGVSQAKAGRNPYLKPDPVLTRAQEYFKKKWGADISVPEVDVKVSDCYARPFNK